MGSTRNPFAFEYIQEAESIHHHRPGGGGVFPFSHTSRGPLRGTLRETLRKLAGPCRGPGTVSQLAGTLAGNPAESCGALRAGKKFHVWDVYFFKDVGVSGGAHVQAAGAKTKPLRKK